MRRLAEQAANVDQVSHMMDMLLLEHIVRIEAAHKQWGDARFADLFLRSQQIALFEEGKPLRPVIAKEESYVVRYRWYSTMPDGSQAIPPPQAEV